MIIVTSVSHHGEFQISISLTVNQFKNIHTYIHTIHTYIHTYTHTYTHTYIHIICPFEKGKVMGGQFFKSMSRLNLLKFAFCSYYVT